MNMKKRNIATIILMVLAFSLFAGEYIHYGHSVKCAKCMEEAKKWPGHYVNVAWRTTEPYKKVGDKVYAQYHCFGGHYYWAEIR